MMRIGNSWLRYCQLSCPCLKQIDICVPLSLVDVGLDGQVEYGLM